MADYWEDHTTKVIEANENLSEAIKGDMADRSVQFNIIFAAVLLALEMLRGVHAVVVMDRKKPEVN